MSHVQAALRAADVYSWENQAKVHVRAGAPSRIYSSVETLGASISFKKSSVIWGPSIHSDNIEVCVCAKVRLVCQKSAEQHLTW